MWTQKSLKEKLSTHDAHEYDNKEIAVIKFLYKFYELQ